MEIRASLKTNPTVLALKLLPEDQAFALPASLRGAATASPPLDKVTNVKCLKYQRGWIKKTTKKSANVVEIHRQYARQEQRWEEESSTSCQSPRHFREAVWRDEHAQVSCLHVDVIAESLLSASTPLLHHSFVAVLMIAMVLLAQWQKKKGVLRVAFFYFLVEM